jgi:hypothetical protein
MNGHETSSKEFSGFDLERWKRRAKRRPRTRMCHAGSILRSSEGEDEEGPGMWSSDEENSTRTTCKCYHDILI